MPTSVRIKSHPLDGRKYRLGEVVSVPDPVAAKLLAGGHAELAKPGSASPELKSMVAAFRDGRGGKAKATAAKRPAPAQSKAVRAAVNQERDAFFKANPSLDHTRPGDGVRRATLPR